MITNKVIPENFVVVRQHREIRSCKPTIEECCALFDGRFTGANCSYKVGKIAVKLWSVKFLPKTISYSCSPIHVNLLYYCHVKDGG